MSNTYPNQRFTTNLSLALFGMDEVLAENMEILDSAYGAGSSVNVNAHLINGPNFNNTTPAAPGGDLNVVWQYDSNGNISAYVPVSGVGSVTSVAMTGDGTIFNSVVTGSPITSSGTLIPALLTQTANTVLAGPTSGGAATPTFRALVTADIPTGIVTWDRIGNAAGALTLSNAGNATTFNQTSAAQWLWANNHASLAGGSAPALVSSGAASVDADSGLGALTLDTTGATLIVALIVADTGAAGIGTGSITDSKSNTWTYATANGSNSTGCAVVAYSYGPTVGSGHVFTLHNSAAGQVYTVAAIYAFSGTLTTSSVFDSIQNTASQTSPFNVGSITPTLGDIVLTYAGGDLLINTATVSGSVQWTNQVSILASHAADDNLSAAICIGAPAIGINPLWTLKSATGTQLVARSTTVCFKAAGVATNALSPIISIAGGYISGGTTTLDQWTIQDVVGTSLTPTSTLTFAHSGSSGETSVSMPQLGLSGNLSFLTDNTYDIGIEPITSAFQRPRNLYMAGSILCASGSSGVTTAQIDIGSTTAGSYAAGLSFYDASVSIFSIPSTSAGKCTHTFDWRFAGQHMMISTGAVCWTANSSSARDVQDSGISRLAAASLAIGNGTAGDTSGTLSMGTLNAVNGLFTLRGDGTTLNFISQSGANTGFSFYTSNLNASSAFFNLNGIETLSWSPKNYPLGTPDTGLSRTGAASLALGNGTAGDFTGALTLGALTQNNNTIATISTTNASPLYTLSANYWTAGSASAPDTWTLQSSLAAGTNGASTLTFTHTGSTGFPTISVPTLTQTFAPTVTNSIGISGAMTGASAAVTTYVGYFNNSKPSTDVSSNTTGSIGVLAAASGSSSNANSRNFGAQFIGYGAKLNVGFHTYAWDNGTGTSTCIGLYASALPLAGGSLGVAGYFRQNSSAPILSGGLGENSVIVSDNGSVTTVNLLTLKQNGTNVGCIKGDGTYAWGTGTGDTGISRLGAASLAIGNGTAGDTTGNISAQTHTVTASGGAPTSAGTAGTVGQIIAYGGNLYFCSVTGGVGAATWNKITMSSV